MNIRPASPNDAHAISRLIQSVAHFFTLDPKGAGAEDFLRSISPGAIESYVNAPNFTYLAGFMDGELAGVVAVRDHSHLYHLFIAPKFQRQGLAKELWLEVMADSIQRGNPGEFTVNSTPIAVPVYESFGFAVSGPKIETMGIAFVPMRFIAESRSPFVQ
jgi:ribosomal protein S18 acetylase RimI-like enzyme